MTEPDPWLKALSELPSEAVPAALHAAVKRRAAPLLARRRQRRTFANTLLSCAFALAAAHLVWAFSVVERLYVSR